MPNAIDVFRAQRDAAEQVEHTLRETTALLNALTEQVKSLAGDQQLGGLLRDQRALLERADAFLHQVRYVREHEIARFWPAVWRRWVLAAAFALASAAAAGAGYAWLRSADAAEIASLRARRAVADRILDRMLTMTPAERRQFEALMKWPPKKP